MPTSLPLVHIFVPTESRIKPNSRSIYLWSHEFWGTAESVCGTSVSHLLLTQPIISNLDVSVQSQQNIIEFQIPIDNLVFMQIFERQQNLGSIESENQSHS